MSECQAHRELTLLGRAERALAEARSIEQFKEIRDQAEAVRTYARSATLGLEIQNYAAEVRLRAERKAGKMLAECKLRGGDRRSKSRDATLKLTDFGITRQQSFCWQLEASLPDADFERYVSRCRRCGKELTSAAVVRLARSGPNGREEDSRSEAELDLACVRARLGELLGQEQRFSCVWANPTWPDTEPNPGSSPSHTSATHSTQLTKLAVRDVVAEQAHLHLAAPAEFLSDAMRVIAGWGFTYRSVLVFGESPRCYGKYWRLTQSFLLLGVRGRLPFRDNGLIGQHEVDESSLAKRQEVLRKLIERVSPGPHLELFGDGPNPGWIVLGKE